MCCDLCCTEFKGWCHSFTRTERALTVLEAVLLVVLVLFLIFLILHLLACSTLKPIEETKKTENEYEYAETERPAVSTGHTTTKRQRSTTRRRTTSTTTTSLTPRQTIQPGLECSWTPSAKTTALTHYYEKSTTLTEFQEDTYYAVAKLKKLTTTGKQHKKVGTKLKHNVDFIQVDQSDGEDAEPLQNKFILSLVKLKPPQVVMFGCILTCINEYWMLTSASCIKAIEEMDSFDSFIIVEEDGTSSKGKIHSVFDLQIHPFYRGTNKSYDLAAIRSESRLVNGKGVQLPTILDNSMITIGERFLVLGFGAYRSIDKSVWGRRLRKVYVYRVAAARCAGGAAGRARGAGGLCAGALPCYSWRGAPLLRGAGAAGGAVLVGVSSCSERCGAAGEPQLYVNIAAVRDWIDNLIKP